MGKSKTPKKGVTSNNNTPSKDIKKETPKSDAKIIESEMV